MLDGELGEDGRGRGEVGVAAPHVKRARRLEPPPGGAERAARPGLSPMATYVLEHFEAFRAWSDETGTPLLLVYLNYRTRDEYSLNAAGRFARMAAEAGLPYLDMTSRFRGTRARELQIFDNDPHPNAEAHAVFAAALEERLSRGDLLSLIHI